MTQQLAPSPKKQLALVIQTMKPNFMQALPPGVDPDRFTRVVMNAVQNDPALLEADKQTLFNSCNRAAQDGLLPDGREGKIVVFKTKIKDANGREQWVKAAQWMPMVGGLRKLAAKHGFSIDAQVVFENDEFIYEMGDEPRLTHRPPQLGQSRGKAIGVYAIATHGQTGEKYREVMDKDAIEKVRAASKGGEYGPWKDWWDEMARKTVVKRIYKMLPIAFDEYDAEVIRRDNEQDYAFNNGNTPVEPTPAPETEAPVKPKRPSALDRVAATAPVVDPDVIEGTATEVPADRDFDHDTGEVF